MKDYSQQNFNSHIQEILDRVKIDLACRSDNTHVGSGLGGNPSEYLFILTHKIVPVGMVDGEPFFKLSGNEIFFHSTSKYNLRKIRETFTKFLEENFPNRETVSQEQLTNPSFMRDLKSDNTEVKLFIRALDHTHELVKWLNLKFEVKKSLKKIEEQECDAVELLFFERNESSLELFSSS